MSNPIIPDWKAILFLTGKPSAKAEDKTVKTNYDKESNMLVPEYDQVIKIAGLVILSELVRPLPILSPMVSAIGTITVLYYLTNKDNNVGPTLYNYVRSVIGMPELIDEDGYYVWELDQSEEDEDDAY